MAFTADITANGRSYPAAYIKASVRLCTTQNTVVQLEVWESQAVRDSGVEPLSYSNDLRTFATNLSLQADNPVAYAYALLEASGEWPDATWNV